jgi:hypothetical protein
MCRMNSHTAMRLVFHAISFEGIQFLQYILVSINLIYCVSITDLIESAEILFYIKTRFIDFEYKMFFISLLTLGLVMKM